MAVAPISFPGLGVSSGGVDFSSLAQLPQVYKQAQAEAVRRQTLAELGQGGQVDPMRLIQSGDVTLANLGIGQLNRQEEAKRRAQLDARQLERDKIEDAFRRQQLGQTASYQNRSLGIQEAAAKRKDTTLADQAKEREQVAAQLGLERGSPAYNTYVLTGKTGRDEALTAGDRKVINEAEDELPNIQGTREALKRALDLNDKAFSGVTAKHRAYLGSNVPGGGLLVDKAGADATTEWQKIMGPEALQVMANTLKGATTDFELKKFIEMLADPTTKPEIRASIIKRLDTLAGRKEELANRRIEQLRGGTYYKPRKPAESGGGAKPISEAEYNALPSGSTFMAPDGSMRVKP